MTQEEIDYSLRGLEEYYKNRQDIINESDTNEDIEMINGLPHVIANCTMDEWCKQHNAIDIEDIQWTA